MGRAIVREPAAFLFDEPLSNLDAKLRAEMRLELKRIQRETGVTTILVTHDQEEALSLSDSMVIMNEGLVVATGAPRELWRRPRHPFVAGFLGVENLLPAVVVDERGARPNDSQSVLTLEPDPSVRAGDALVVGVRSADVTLAPRQSVAADLPNRVGGVVREVNYRGAASLYRVATPLAGQPLIATSDADFAIGAELDVCIAPASLMRLAAGGG